MSPGPGERDAIDYSSRLPLGTDAVLPANAPQYSGTPKEQCQQRIVVPVLPGTNVIKAGADTSVGKVLVEGGTRLTAAAVSALAMAGVEEVLVQARPSVALCTVHNYYKSPSAGQNSTWAPNAVTPLVLGLLAQWGVEVTTVMRMDGETGVVDSSTVSGGGLKELCATHDLTIAVGKINNYGWHIIRFAGIVHATQLCMIDQHPNLPGTTEWELNPPAFRPFESAVAADTSRTHSSGPVNDTGVRCILALLEGLPLSVLVSMYLVVRPILDALQGIDRQRVSPGSTYPPPTPEEKLYLEKLKDPNFKPKRPQGVRWFNGILVAPAPRDLDRHWVQLARFDHSQPGRVGLIPLPSEEWRVSSMAEAEAMVAIEKGEGDMPVGSEVQFFLLD
jgi:molybdopterin biosynthesis enzyme